MIGKIKASLDILHG